MSQGAPIAQQLRAATQLVYAGRFLQAEAGARQVLARQPRNAEAHYVLALSAMFQKRHADALPAIDKAMSLDAALAQYPFVRGMCLAGLGRVDEAVADYRRALALRPAFFEALANLGNLLELNGRYADAEDVYRRALALKADAAPVLNGYGICLLAREDLKQAADAFARAVAADPAFATGHNNLGNTLARLEQFDDAIVHLEEAVRLRPGFTEAWISLADQRYLKHLRDAAAAGQDGRGATEYVREFFDRFAPAFDQRLVEDLEYRTPQRMAQFLAPWLADRKGSLRVEDLGCGTGLSGLVLKPYAARIAGVDLSGRMLAKARERHLYDSLHEAEIAAYLEGKPAGECDLAAAMDVFVYVGDLEAIFRAVARSLAPGGMFAFSVERLDGEGDFRLARSGRYAHSRQYLRSLAKAHGLAEWKIEDAVIRKDAGRPVPGLHAAFTKA